MNRTEEESIELHEKGETVENEVLPCEEQEVVDNSDSCNISSSTARAGQVDSREKSVELLNQSETDAENMSEKEADPKSRCCSKFLEILKNRRGHVVKTIILGLGLNAFDVFSDAGVGISHAQDKNVTRFFAANDTIPEYCVPVTMTRSDEDYSRLFNATEPVHTHVCLEEDVVWATITFGCIQLPAVVLTLCGVVGMVMFEGCSRIPSSIDHSVPPSSAPTTSRQCLHARLCPDGVVELHLPLRRGSS